MLRKVIIYVLFTTLSLNAYSQQSVDSVPSVLYKRYFHKDARLMLNRESAIANPFSITYKDNPSNEIGLYGLNRSGSISRAITVGNNQDLSLNSSLNLQISGRLSEELEVVAVISDDNIPIQPEGNTQQIQDFDRVYIQLLHKNYTLTAGDFELRKPNSYFLNYLKKAKGGYVQSTFENTKNYTIKNDAAVAIAKGKYNRLQFLGKEGIQGPYRLTGSSNESFIIVLAGTERVFIDGMLLKRGENQDYTIDYNTAEITFMPRKIITAYSRITVEFEYSDKNYSRSLTTINSSFESKKNSFRFNYYNEQDSKNKPLLQSLNDQQKLFLSTIGDETNQAFYSSADSLGYSNTEIRYKKIDSAGQSVYVYSTNPEDAFYRLSFSLVGTNQGNYVQDNNLANGRVFKYVSPVNGIPQGNYEPVVLLVTPKKTSMLTFAAEHKSEEKFSIGSEVAISQVDLNLYSNLDDANNIGLASKSYISYRNKIKGDSSDAIFWTSNLQAEILDKNFRQVEFYRPVEFNRDFNINNTTRTAEQWYTFQTSLEKDKKNILFYRTAIFLKDSIYRGIQQNIGTDLDYKNIRLYSNASLLTTELNSNKQQSNFLKHQLDLSKSWSNIILGIAEETEKNLYTNSNNDTLGSTSFSFYNYKAYIKSPEKNINKYLLEYSNRLDESPYKNELRTSTRAENITLNTELNKNPNALLGFGINYRKLNVISKSSNLKSEENIVSRIRFDRVAFRGLVTSNTYYEIGTGQEPQRAYTYLKVPAGQGVYVFRDYNNNGVQELNEFEIAKYSYEADYIRVSLVSTNFIRTKSTVFSENVLIDPSRRWGNKTNFMKYINMFSMQSNLKIDRKIQRDASSSIFNPFENNIDDSSLINISTQYRETFFFNRSNPIFGMDYTYQGNKNKALLSIGFDARALQEHMFKSRWNILGKYSFLTEIKRGEKNANSEASVERNFNIQYYGIKPELAYQITTEMRWSIFYSYLYQENKISNNEISKQQKLSAELKYNAGGKASIQTQFNFIYNDFIGSSNSAIAYEMLEALQPGKNLTWSANWQKNIGPSLQLSILYDGRSSEKARVIHAGSMQVRAFF